MVKNTTGGSKHKSMARKLVNAPVSNKIRYSEDEDECYAKVTKMLGNGMCHVNLLHKETFHDNVVCFKVKSTLCLLITGTSCSSFVSRYLFILFTMRTSGSDKNIIILQ